MGSVAIETCCVMVKDLFVLLVCLFVCLFVYIVCISGLCMSRNLFSTKQCFFLIATCNLKVLYYCHFLVSVKLILWGGGG